MGTISPNYKMNKQPHKYTGKGKVIAIALSATVLFLVIFLFSIINNAVEDAVINAGQLQNIDYISGTEYDEIHSINGDLKPISRFSQIKKSNADNYVFIRFQLPPADNSRRLDMYTYFSQASVRINDNEVLNTNDRSKLFGNTAHITQLIEPTTDPVTVEITVKCVLSPNFNIFVTPSGSFYFYFMFILPAVCVISLIFYIKGIVDRRKKESRHITKYESVLIILLSGLILCFCAIIMPGSFLLLYKIGLAIVQLSQIVLLYTILKDASIPEKTKQLVVSLGLIFLAVILMSQHQDVIVLLLKLYGFYFLLSMCACFIWKQNFRINDIVVSSLVISIYLVMWSLFYLNLNLASMLSYLPLLLSFPCCLYLGIHIRKSFVTASENADIFASDNPADNPKDLMIYKPVDLGRDQDLLEIFLMNNDNMVHSRNVSLYVYTLCKNAGMSEEKSCIAAQASFVHDIGKMLLPYNLVKSTNSFTNDEFEEMKKHTMFGYQLFESGSSELMKACAIVAKEHHERADGNGYYGLKESQIHIYAQITAIADVFDATTTKRSYKKAWSFQDGFDYIKSNAGNLFSSHYVDVFVNSKDEIYKIYCMTRFRG